MCDAFVIESKIHTDEINLAETLFNLFVSEYESLYGIDNCSFNVHQLCHMAKSVRLWGPLWAWSAFPFEDENGYIKKVKDNSLKNSVEKLFKHT